MAKRMSGEGSYGKRVIKGYTYYYYRDPEGHFVYGKSQAELKEKIKDWHDPSKQKRPPKEIAITIGDFVRDWFYTKKYQEVGITIQPTTFDAYEDGLKIRLFKHEFALHQISILSSALINEYFRSLAQKYSRKSIQKTWEVLRLCFTDTDYERHYLVPSNIDFYKIRIPTESNVAVKKRDVQFTSADDMELLYQEAFKTNPRSGHAYGNAAKMLVFIMYSGLRLAEACGLTWRNVDMKNGFVSVATTYSVVKTRDASGNATGYQYIDKAPKTETSATTIPYRKRAGEILQLMNELNPDHRPDDYVFLSENHTPYKKRIVERTLERMTKNAGLEDRGYTVHSLRHGYGSILYQEGIDIKTISKLLRHADIATTANIYVQTTNDTLKQALDNIDEK